MESPAPTESPIKINLLLLASGGAGRFFLMQRYLIGMDPIEGYDPPIEDLFVRTKVVDGLSVRIDGYRIYEEDMNRDRLYQQADAIMICFDLADYYRISELIKPFYQEIIRHKGPEFTAFAVVGCKSDKMIEGEPVEKFLSYMKEEIVAICGVDASFFVTSAVANTNVTEAFECVLREAITHKQGKPGQLSAKKNKQASKCALS